MRCAYTHKSSDLRAKIRANLQHIIDHAEPEGRLRAGIIDDDSWPMVVIMRALFAESIYGTTGGPYINGEWGGSTMKGDVLYLHVFKWTEGVLVLPRLPRNIRRCLELGGENVFLKPAVEDVVNKYLDCGDLSKGFARLHCAKCNKDYLLAFSCKGRWFCPSCHQKKVLLFGEFIKESVAYPLPHRQYVFSLPKMLRVYFRNNRELLKELCKIANECLLEYLRQVMRQPAGQLGMVMTIHTFGEYMGYNSHLHALVADGLFMESGMFYVAPRLSTRPLEELFRVRVIKMLVEEGLLAEELARKLLSWTHSGFSVHNGKPIDRNDADGLERVAQYIIRNPFSEQKMTYNEETGTVIYRSRKHANTKRNFEVFSAQDFIAAITQHIPDKGFQMVRYYGWYSNRARGDRAKRQDLRSQVSGISSLTVIDVSDYQPRRLPSKKWRELIKKVWEIDPLECPRCGREMKMIALIDDRAVIERILRSLGLWSVNLQPAVINMHVTGPPEYKSGAGRDDAEPIWDYASDADPFPDYDTETVTCPAKLQRSRMAYANE